MEGRKDISFGETPFSVADAKVLDCQLGPSTSNSGHLRVNVSGSKVPECQAHVEVKSLSLYHDFALSKDEKEVEVAVPAGGTNHKPQDRAG